MKEIILRGSARYLYYQYGKTKKSTIDYIMLNLPFRCNYQCIKCCNRFRKFKSGKLSLDKIRNTILRLKKLGAKVLVIAGEGEPTLNKNFKSIVKFVDENGLIPYVFTNGSKINQKLAYFLSKHKASLIINMDSFNPQKYDVYVGRKGSFNVLMQNFGYIRRYYQKNTYELGEYKVVSLAVNLVLNNENSDQIPKIKEFCNEDMVFVVNEPINIGSAKKNWKSRFDDAEANVYKKVSYPLGTLAPDKECSYMRNGLSVGSDGRILTCAYALETQDLYGNIGVKNLISARKKVMKSVDEFYAKYGKSRCILRHPEYKKFIEETKNVEKNWNKSSSFRRKETK